MIRLFTGFLLGFLSGWWTSPMIDSRRRHWKLRLMVYKRRLKRAKAKTRRLLYRGKAARKNCGQGGVWPWLR